LQFKKVGKDSEVTQRLFGNINVQQDQKQHADDDDEESEFDLDKY
jgi:hypothetical protein